MRSATSSYHPSLPPLLMSCSSGCLESYLYWRLQAAVALEPRGPLCPHRRAPRAVGGQPCRWQGAEFGQ